MILKEAFFNRPTVKVARDLIGCFLVRKVGSKIEKYMIVETEAYDGEKDLACHASKGRTKRSEVLFGPPGHFYIYFTYGMHWLLNVVVGPKDYPAGVLIRGIIDQNGNAINGPARITKKLMIDGNLHGKLAHPKNGLWFESAESTDWISDILRTRISDIRIKATSRIGVAYAGPIWSKKKWRFVLDFKVY